MPATRPRLEPPDDPDPPPWIEDAVAGADGHVAVLECDLSSTLADLVRRVADETPRKYACKTKLAGVHVWFSLTTATSPDLTQYEQGIDVPVAEQRELVTTVAHVLQRLWRANRTWLALPSHDLELEMSLEFPSALLTPHVLIGDLLREQFWEGHLARAR